MSDTITREEVLETLMTEMFVTELMLRNVDMIVQGGTEGIQMIAAEQPESILNTLTNLVTIIRAQTLRFGALIEAELDFEDFLADQMEKHGITPDKKN